MEKSTILASLALFTLLSGMAVAAYQLWTVRDTKVVKDDVKKLKGEG